MDLGGVSRPFRRRMRLSGRSFARRGQTYLDQLRVVSVGYFCLKVISATLLVTEERRHWLFGGVLILLDTLLVLLNLDHGLGLLGWFLWRHEMTELGTEGRRRRTVESSGGRFRGSKPTKIGLSLRPDSRD